MNILADATLPGLYEAFPPPFILTQYTCPEEIPRLLKNQDVLLCRSTLKVNEALLTHHPLQFVATASSGTDHLDHAFLKAQNIHIIDAKGCNASSVADYVMACLASMEKQRLVRGRTAGIIGLGKVGTQVYERLKKANFQLIAYDPLKELLEKPFKSAALEDLYQVDLLCIHAELHNTAPYPSMNLIDSYFLSQLNPKCVIINAARGGIVNEEALLNTAKSLIYCTDVYLNEPTIDERVLTRASLCTPHIAGHSLEAKYAAVALLSEQLHQFLKHPIPEYAMPQKPPTVAIQENQSWQEFILSLYNPMIETQQLKEADDKKAAFLSLRKQHQTRHDFLTYFAQA